MAIIPVVLIIAIAIFLHFLRRRLRRSYLINKIPGPRGIPLLGNDMSFLVPPRELWKLARRWNADFYPIFKFWSARGPGVNIRHPDDAEILLSSPRHITKSEIYDFLHPWFGTGLLTSTGRKWSTRRKILTPAFHFNVLREFSSIFDEEGRRMVDDIKGSEGPAELDVLPLVTEYTLNTICETAMGLSPDKIADSQYNYREAVYDMGRFIVHRLLRPWIHPDLIFALTPTGRQQKKALKTIHEFSSKIIAERQQYRDLTGGIFLKEDNVFRIHSSSKKRLAMLDLLIASMKQGDIDEAGVREEVDTFIFEGHDTTAMGMCFTLLLLAEHTEYQQKAREEVDDVLEKSHGKMSITELQQFTYLDRCIREALRLFPSVPMISRTIEEDLYLKKYVVPGGSDMHLHIYDLHRDPNFWPDPNRFDPDRFLPERIQGRHPFSYIPFSAGQRNCIGQKFAMLELKAFVGHLLHNFHLEPVDLASHVRLIPDLVLRSTHPLRIKFLPRETSAASP